MIRGRFFYPYVGENYGFWCEGSVAAGEISGEGYVTILTGRWEG